MPVLPCTAGLGATACAAAVLSATPAGHPPGPTWLSSQPSLTLNHSPTIHNPPQLARKLADVREAAERGEPLPFTPRGGGHPPTATATATVTATTPGAAISPLREGIAAATDAVGPPPKSAKKGLLGLAGL